MRSREESFFLPGPTGVRGEILDAMARPMIPHRGEEMRALLARVAPRLGALFGTRRPVYIATCAATGMMDAAILCGTRRRVLSLVAGAFGERFARVAEACGREVTRLTVPPAVVEAMRMRGFVIGGGYGALRAGTFRIGHMGDHSVEGVERLLADLGGVLGEA